MNTQLVALLLALNAISASALGGVILYKGITRKCNAQTGYGLGMLAFSLVYSLLAKDMMWWHIGVVPSIFALAMLKTDAILDRISDRCDSMIARISCANLIPIKVSSHKR